MSEKNSWSRYIDATSNGEMNTTIAARVGVEPSTIGRWRTGAVDPKPRQVVDYARAFGLSPIAALIASGYLASDEVELDVVVPSTSVRELDEEILAAELLRRARDRKRVDVGGLSEDDLRRHFDVAAGSDDSQPDEDESTP